MKRILAALLLALVTFAGVYGLAASLNLTTDSLGSATTTSPPARRALLTRPTRRRTPPQHRATRLGQ
jgi:hypothetical protein